MWTHGRQRNFVSPCQGRYGMGEREVSTPVENLKKLVVCKKLFLFSAIWIYLLRFCLLTCWCLPGDRTSVLSDLLLRQILHWENLDAFPQTRTIPSSSWPLINLMGSYTPFYAWQNVPISMLWLQPQALSIIHATPCAVEAHSAFRLIATRTEVQFQSQRTKRLSAKIIDHLLIVLEWKQAF